MIVNYVKVVAIWIKFFGIPLEFWTSKELSKIASSVGKPLYTDLVMKKGIKLDYARIYVEIVVDSGCLKSIDLCLPNGEKYL